MSLMAKTTLLYLIVTLIVFGLGGAVTYHMVKQEVAKETDYYLRDTFYRIKQAIEDGKPPEVFTNDRIQICELPLKPYRDTVYHFSDTLGKHPFLDRLEPYRKLSLVRQIGGHYYKVTMMDVLIESDDMYEGVVKVLSQLFLFLSLTLIVSNFIISRYLLSPFWDTLSKIKWFSLKEDQKLSFDKTTTSEFKQLNTFISRMTGKAKKDYQTLKEFNENVSHEMQTPIAVARGKLELLLESPNLDEKQLHLIQSASESVGKISRIGQSLTLLNKIENEEFSDMDEIDFSAALHKAINQFDELIQLRGLSLVKHIQDDVQLNIHPALADTLLSNLLKNAVQHNTSGGSIELTLTSHKLEVLNPGPSPNGPTEALFQRFKKGNPTGASLGLGLAIVKQIVDVSRWAISYDYRDEKHLIQVLFKPAL